MNAPHRLGLVAHFSPSFERAQTNEGHGHIGRATKTTGPLACADRAPQRQHLVDAGDQHRPQNMRRVSVLSGLGGLGLAGCAVRGHTHGIHRYIQRGGHTARLAVLLGAAVNELTARFG